MEPLSSNEWIQLSSYEASSVKRTWYAASATVTSPTISTTRSKSHSSKLRDSPLRVTTR